jgi:hypothetical protein
MASDWSAVMELMERPVFVMILIIANSAILLLEQKYHMFRLGLIVIALMVLKLVTVPIIQFHGT